MPSFSVFLTGSAGLPIVCAGIFEVDGGVSPYTETAKKIKRQMNRTLFFFMISPFLEPQINADERGLKIFHKSSYLESGLAKIQYQSQFMARRFKII